MKASLPHSKTSNYSSKSASNSVRSHGQMAQTSTRCGCMKRSGRIKRGLSPFKSAPLGNTEMRYFEELVTARANDIVSKWIDFFVLHKPVKSERITRRLK